MKRVFFAYAYGIGCQHSYGPFDESDSATEWLVDQKRDADGWEDVTNMGVVGPVPWMEVEIPQPSTQAQGFSDLMESIWAGGKAYDLPGASDGVIMLNRMFLGEPGFSSSESGEGLAVTFPDGSTAWVGESEVTL